MSIKETPERKGQTSSYVESDHAKEGGPSQWWCFQLKGNGGNSFFGEHDCTSNKKYFQLTWALLGSCNNPSFWTSLEFGQVVKVQTYSTVFRRKVLGDSEFHSLRIGNYQKSRRGVCSGRVSLQIHMNINFCVWQLGQSLLFWTKPAEPPKFTFNSCGLFLSHGGHFLEDLFCKNAIIMDISQPFKEEHVSMLK